MRSCRCRALSRVSVGATRRVLETMNGPWTSLTAQTRCLGEVCCFEVRNRDWDGSGRTVVGEYLGTWLLRVIRRVITCAFWSTVNAFWDGD